MGGATLGRPCRNEYSYPVPKVERVSAVTFAVRDMARSVAFYRQLGFTMLRGGEDASFTSFRFGEAFVNLAAVSTYMFDYIFDYIEVFYNQRPCHSILGQVSPATFERWAEMRQVA